MASMCSPRHYSNEDTVIVQEPVSKMTQNDQEKEAWAKVLL